jgi:hypothetical protein
MNHSNVQMMMLGVVFFADMTLPGSCDCGGRPYDDDDNEPPPPEYALTISIPDCSCFSNAICLYVYNGDAADNDSMPYNPSFRTENIACAPGVSYVMSVTEGLHDVRAITTKGTWASRHVVVTPDGGANRVELTCP